jgi:hypothetical protein
VQDRQQQLPGEVFHQGPEKGKRKVIAGMDHPLMEME